MSTIGPDTCLSNDDLVSQLNIEKRPAVGDSLLTATHVLQVRPDISASLEQYAAETASYGNCSDHWQTSCQETVKNQAIFDVAGGTEATAEIDLNDYLSYPSLQEVLDTLDIVDSSGPVEDQPQPTSSEDAIDGFDPVTSSHQLAGMSLAAAAARPSVWKVETMMSASSATQLVASLNMVATGTVLATEPSVMPSYRLSSAYSPVGQITGTMGDLAIDKGRQYPRLRQVLTEPTAARLQNTGREQVTDAIFVFVLH